MMDGYIELTEELILAMRAGARAIANTKRYHGTIFVSDAFSENPKEIPYLQAAEILYAASTNVTSADVAPVRHERWIPVTEQLPEKGDPVIICTDKNFVYAGELVGDTWFLDNASWTETVTHWMPLPEPPKEDK